VIDRVGNIASGALVGSLSQLSIDILGNLASSRLRRVGVAATSPTVAAFASQYFQRAGVSQVSARDFSAHEAKSHEEVVDYLFADGDVDTLIIEALGDFAIEDFDGSPAACASLADDGFTSTMSLTMHSLSHLKIQGHGCMVLLLPHCRVPHGGEQTHLGAAVVGSVHAGLREFSDRLGNELAGTGVRLVVADVPTATGAQLEVAASGIAEAIRSQRALVKYSSESKGLRTRLRPSRRGNQH